MKAPAIFQSYEQNILRNAIITADVTPVASYDLNVLGYLRPDWFVALGTTTATIRFTLANGSPGTPERGDVLIIPNSNIATGAATWVASGGLNQALTFSGPMANGIQQSMVLDLTVADPDPNDRMGHWWELQIVNNPVDIILGGAVALYSPKQYLVDRDFQWGYTIRETQGTIEGQQNEYLTRHIQDTLTSERELDLVAGATTADADRLQDWFRGNHGRARPGLLWFDPAGIGSPAVPDGFLGIWQRTFERQVVIRNDEDALGSLEQIRVTFTELSKGIAL